MSSGQTAHKLEIAHVLFMDMVAYSSLPMDQQREFIWHLQEIVRALPEYRQALSTDELISLPTGDGMALAFFGDPSLPIRCARQINSVVRKDSRFGLRMGIHSGPVFRVPDINANRNIAGGGINLAQRVMDCGDSGHLLISKTFVDMLLPLDSTWKASIHNLGDVQVKHGVVTHIFNVFGEGFGNPDTPKRLQSLSQPQSWIGLTNALGNWLSAVPLMERHFRNRVTFGLFTLLLSLAAILGGFWYLSRSYSTPSLEAEQWYREGVAALQQGTNLKATRALERAVELDKGFALAHARLADAWAELDFAGKAQDEMLRASSLEMHMRLPTVDKEYLDAVRSTLTRDFDSAIRAYSHILQGLPTFEKAQGYVDLGRAYERSADIPRATWNYLEAARLSSEDPAPLVRLAILESRLGKTADAATAFSHAASLYRAASNVEGLAEIDYQEGYAATVHGDLPHAREFLEKSLRAAQEIPSVQLEIRALTRIGVVEDLAGNLNKSVEIESRAIKLARDNGIDYWAIDGLVRLGSAYLGRGDYTKAEPPLQDALRLARESQRIRLEANACLNLASIRSQQEKPDETISLAQSALDYYRRAGFSAEAVAASVLIARSKWEKADLKGALAVGLDALKPAKDSGALMATMQVEELLGGVLLALQRYPEALSHFRSALETARTIGDGVEYQTFHCADALWHLGEYEQAQQLLASIPSNAARLPNIKSNIERILAHMSLSRKDYRSALVQAHRALKGGTLSPEMIVDLEDVSAFALAATRSLTQAGHISRDALARAQRQPDSQMIAESTLNAAFVNLALGAPKQARPLAESAHSFFSASGQKESELRSLLCLSRISRVSGDGAESAFFASKGMDILAETEHNWGTLAYQKYLARPDIKSAKQELSTLMH